MTMDAIRKARSKRRVVNRERGRQGGTLTAQQSALAARMHLAQQIGQTNYSGARDYYRVLGYKKILTPSDYLSRYERQDIAARVVDLPADDTWKRPPQISEDGDTETEFVRGWEELVKRMRVWSKFNRADRLAGVGRFGILLLGFATGELSEPIEPGSLSGPKSLVYMRPLSEIGVEIEELEEDVNDPRFGQPTMYRIKLDNLQGARSVHWTRVLHIAEERMDSELYHVPRMQRVFNRLDDLTKYVGGAAEATWLLMRRGLVFKTQEGYTLRSQDASDRDDQLEEYAHDMARFLTLEGLDVADLGSMVVDVSGPFDVVLSLIAAASGIPKRVLVGSAAGELSAAREDTRQWYAKIASRQVRFAEPEILRAFIDRCILLGVLPAPTSGEYDVGTQDDRGEYSWPPLFELTDLEDANVIQTRALAVQALADPLASYPVSVEEIRELLGFPPEEEGGTTGNVALAAQALGVTEEEFQRAVWETIERWP
jgi:hypothetical protein